MTSGIIGQVVELVNGTKSQTESQQTDSVESESTDLYTCTDCSVTYIKNDMQSCPSCDGPVERTLSFSELGVGPGDGN